MLKDSHVVLIRIVALLERENGSISDTAILLQCVRAWREGQDGLVIRWHTRKTQLG